MRSGLLSCYLFEVQHPYLLIIIRAGWWCWWDVWFETHTAKKVKKKLMRRSTWSVSHGHTPLERDERRVGGAGAAGRPSRGARRRRCFFRGCRKKRSVWHWDSGGAELFSFLSLSPSTISPSIASHLHLVSSSNHLVTATQRSRWNHCIIIIAMCIGRP